jgi:hypothetical protein
MTKTRFISLGALALVAAVHAPLRAQGSSTQVQLAFGYECGDRFLVRNDGTNPVVIEYAVAGSQDKSQLHLNGRQSAEIASAQEGSVELWVSGKVVASEPKGHRACGAPRTAAGGNNGVTVRPINPDAEMTSAPADSAYAQPEVVVVAPRPYDYYYPYSYGPYGYYGYSPFYYPYVGFYGRVGLGGYGRGIIGRGPGGRGRGRR